MWLLSPLTLSTPDNMYTVILWFEVGNSFGKLGFDVRKKPQIKQDERPDTSHQLLAHSLS